MSTLEDSVRTLAGALDALESRLEERLHDLSLQSDVSVAARRQARAARLHAAEAAETLSLAIGDLKALLRETAAAPAPAGAPTAE